MAPPRRRNYSTPRTLASTRDSLRSLFEPTTTSKTLLDSPPSVAKQITKKKPSKRQREDNDVLQMQTTTTASADLIAAASSSSISLQEEVVHKTPLKKIANQKTTANESLRSQSHQQTLVPAAATLLQNLQTAATVASSTVQQEKQPRSIPEELQQQHRQRRKKFAPLLPLPYMPITATIAPVKEFGYASFEMHPDWDFEQRLKKVIRRYGQWNNETEISEKQTTKKDNKWMQNPMFVNPSNAPVSHFKLQFVHEKTSPEARVLAMLVSKNDKGKNKEEKKAQKVSKKKQQESTKRKETVIEDTGSAAPSRGWSPAIIPTLAPTWAPNPSFELF